MTFEFPIDLIRILPDRQRKDLGDIVSLANSIATIGQISPIILSEADEEGRRTLIAGERRLTAVKQLRRASILSLEFSSLSESEKTLLELEENLRRKNLSWQEEVRAVQKYVEISGKPLEEAAKDLSIFPSSLSAMCRVAEEMVKENNLSSASSWSAAYEVIRIQANKATNAVLEGILGGEDIVFPVLAEKPGNGGGDTQMPPGNPANGGAATVGATPTAPLSPTPPTALKTAWYAQVSDFASFAPEYSGRRFNFLHCDFPYGLNMDKANLQNSQARWTAGEDGRYDDSPELFDRLVRAFFKNQDRFIADSAHCIFWLAFKNLHWVSKLFEDYGWKVCETPLIWHKSDNAGIAPDVRRWPRRTYEVAIFASRGDRKMAKLKAASYSGPTTKEHHLSEKPLDMLSHFFELVVDEHTTILDPTCGSGTALEVAKKLGASAGLGLDVMQTHVDYTNRRLR